MDSEALQQYRAIDWGNPTEADMWVAAAAGVSSPSPLSASQQADAYRSSAGRSRYAFHVAHYMPLAHCVHCPTLAGKTQSLQTTSLRLLTALMRVFRP